MTLEEGLNHFFNSDVYKDRSKEKDAEGGRLRKYKSRWNNSELKSKAAITMLSEYGYTVVEEYRVEPPKQTAVKKPKKQ